MYIILYEFSKIILGEGNMYIFLYNDICGFKNFIIFMVVKIM